MLGAERNHAERAHVLVEDHELRRRLDELLREQPEHDAARDAGRQALARRVVDAAAVERFEHLLRRPVLVRRPFAPGGPIVRRADDRRGRVAPRAADAEARVRFVPAAGLRAAALPHAGEVRFAVARARQSPAARPRRALAPRPLRAATTPRRAPAQADRALHRTSTAGAAAAVPRARGRAEHHLLAARQRDLARMPPVTAVARAPAGNGHRVAELHLDVASPADAVQRHRRIAFELPVHDLAGVVFDVEIDMACAGSSTRFS